DGGHRSTISASRTLRADPARGLVKALTPSLPVIRLSVQFMGDCRTRGLGSNGAARTEGLLGPVFRLAAVRPTLPLDGSPGHHGCARAAADTSAVRNKPDNVSTDSTGSSAR